MSSGKSEIILQEPTESLFENNFERIDISQLVIPFFKIFKSHKPKDIYSGNEVIPFKERELEFKMILRQEFNELKVT